MIKSATRPGRRTPGRWTLSVLVLIGLALLAPTGGVGAPVLASARVPDRCGHRVERCREQLTLPSGAALEVYRNVPLAGSATVTHALIVVHGAGRNPVATFTGMMEAAGMAGVVDHTLVLAPWFKTREDKPGKKDAVWTDDGWKQGDDATRPAGLSSFTVADDIVALLADKARFPNLSAITLVGHSAGGQFTQRYAVFGREPNTVGGVSFNYVVANPSSFVYLDPARPTASGTAYAVPAGDSCPGYNTYKYGLDGRTGYVAALTPDQALASYLSRRVTIINGDQDTVDNGDLDNKCAAMAEGPNRLRRGEYFFNRIHGPHPGAPQDRVVVPGVAHDHYALFDSPLAWPALFGTSTATSDPGFLCTSGDSRIPCARR